MNWEQLKAILWLRWRLTMNQARKHGQLWAILVAILAWLLFLTSLCSFFIALAVGMYIAPKLDANGIMYVCDGLAFAFLFSWMMGMLFELQQSELLSLRKLMHLPVSLRGTFVCNYFTSLVSVSLSLFMPVMVGFTVALAINRGLAMLVMLPLAMTFAFMVTAGSYQLQGWLASLMTNPRRRRSVVVGVSLVVMFGAQSPQIVNVLVQRAVQRGKTDQTQAYVALTQKLNESLLAGQITPEQSQAELKEFRRSSEQRRTEMRQRYFAQIHRWASWGNAVVPVGWLAYGAKTAAEGSVWPGLLGLFGAGLIGTFSLRRAYRTVLRAYLGDVSSGDKSIALRAPIAVAVSRPKSTAPVSNWLERRWPWVSEQAAAMTWMNLRCLTRAPEVRMIFAGSILATIIVIAIVLAQGVSVIPVAFRPMIGLGAMALPMMTAMPLLQNQFGMDRSGFRSLVLCSAVRRDILLGKNLSLATALVGTAVLMQIGVQVFVPISVTHLAAVILQTAVTCLAMLICGNFFSIRFPFAMASGSAKPASANTSAILSQLALMIGFPFLLAPGFAAFGLETIGHWIGIPSWLPVFLLLSFAELLAVVVTYCWSLNRLGQLLHQREQQVLSAVAMRVE